MAGLSRLDHAGDDHAAPPVRLLLADAHAAARDGLGRERGADRLSDQDAEGGESPPRASSVDGGAYHAKASPSPSPRFCSPHRRCAAQQKPLDPAKVDAAIVAAFPTAPADWKPRLDQDETCRTARCSENAAEGGGRRDRKREKATIEYPADGKLMGDWKEGESSRSPATGCASPTIRRAGQRRQLLRLPPADQGGGQLRHHRAEPARLRQDPRISARPTPRRPTKRSTTRRPPIRARTCRASAPTRC